VSTAAFALLGGVAIASAQDAASEAITIVGQRASQTAPDTPAVAGISVITKRTCDGVCDFINQAMGTKADHPPAISLPAMKVRTQGAAKVIVTWQGSVTGFGQPTMPTFTNVILRDMQLDLQIQDKPAEVDIDAPGAAKFGATEVMPTEAQTPQFHQTWSVPVTLTRTFNQPAATNASYFLRARAEFRTSISGSFEIRGGHMTALVIAD
jgi:hypothetical protein